MLITNSDVPVKPTVGPVCYYNLDSQSANFSCPFLLLTTVGTQRPGVGGLARDSQRAQRMGSLVS